MSAPDNPSLRTPYTDYRAPRTPTKRPQTSATQTGPVPALEGQPGSPSSPLSGHPSGQPVYTLLVTDVTSTEVRNIRWGRPKTSRVGLPPVPSTDVFQGGPVETPSSTEGSQGPRSSGEGLFA